MVNLGTFSIFDVLEIFLISSVNNMKTNYLILGVLCVLLASWTSNKKHVNGWYFITDNKTNTLDPKPIVTVSDFGMLRIDSMPDSKNSMSYMLVGKVKNNKVKAWENATEQAIGKQIGFLYNGEIISAPKVNMKIESGTFSITSEELIKNREKTLEIYDHLKEEMK